MDKPGQNQSGVSALRALPEKAGLFAGLLAERYTLRLRVTGTSMSPFMKTGAVVTLSPTPFDRLKIGDIIFCRHEKGGLKLHRLIAIKKNRLITKGDALDLPDCPVDATGYLGRVIRIEGRRSFPPVSRDMETRMSRVVNHVLAVYHRCRSYLVCRFIRLKSALPYYRPTIPENR